MLEVTNELSFEIDEFLDRRFPSPERYEEKFLTEAKDALVVAKGIIHKLERIDEFHKVTKKNSLQNNERTLSQIHKLQALKDFTLSAKNDQKNTYKCVGERVKILKDFETARMEKESRKNLKKKTNELWDRMHSLTVQFHEVLKRRGELESYLVKEEMELERGCRNRISHKRAKSIAKRGEKCTEMFQAKACFAYATHKNFGYVFGGWNSKNEILNSVERCNLETGEWTSLAPMTEDCFDDDELSVSSSSSDGFFSVIETPICRFGWSAVVVGNDIYVTGGFDYEAHNTTYIFHTSTRTWRRGPQMRSGRYLHASASAGSKVFVFGGYGNSTCEMLDCSSNTPQWLRLPEMPYAVSDCTAATIGKRIYICCVRNEDGNTLSTCLVFNTKTLQWEPEIKMTTRLHGGAAVAIGNQLHVVGAAADVIEGENKCAAPYEVLDTSTNRFVSVSSATDADERRISVAPRCYHGIFVTPQKGIMLVGGMTPRLPPRIRRISKNLYYGWDKSYRNLMTTFLGSIDLA